MVTIVWAEALPVMAEQVGANPWVGVTVRGLSAGDHVINVWRTADGVRAAVRGGRRRPVLDSDYLIDYEVPLGRPVTYEVEILSGPDAGKLLAPYTITVDSLTGFIQDPDDPTGAMPIHLNGLPNGEPTLISGALAELQYAMGANIMPILGSSMPVSIMGQRMAAAGVNFSLLTDAAEQNTALRNLLMGAGPVLVRPLPSWGGALPALCYFMVPATGESPVDAHKGGVLTQWNLVGDLVAAPTGRILIAIFTYQDVAALYATYEQKQQSMAGKTYLDDLKDPLGAASRPALMRTAL